MSVDRFPEKHVCITGIGQSEVARPSSKTPIALTVDACLAAIADAGLTPADIDGITTWPGPIQEPKGFSPVGSTEAVLALGLDPVWTGASTDGHAHMSAMFSAIQAIASGLCRHVLVFRTVGQASVMAASKLTAGQANLIGGKNARVSGGLTWNVAHNAISAAHIFGLYGQAYFDVFGANSRQLGAIAVNGRAMAAHNPKAIFHKPLTIDEYLESRLICSPLRLFDCDVPVDGSTAFLFSARDASRDLGRPPINIEAMGMSLGGIGLGFHKGDFTHMPSDRAGEMLWSRTDLKPADSDTAQIYDGFSILTLMWMESLQLCGRGEAAAFVEGGSRIGLDGQLPLNTGGGQLSAGRLHGYGHTHEACMQLWGRGGARQVADAQVCVVANGGFGYGALLLTRD